MHFKKLPAMPKNGMRPVHPGEVLLEDYLTPLGMSANALARYLHVPANRVSAILNGSRSITAETALRLSRFFKTTPGFWMNLQSTYDLRLAEMADGKRIEHDVAPLSAHA